MPVHDVLPVLSVSVDPHHGVQVHDSSFCSAGEHHNTSFVSTHHGTDLGNGNNSDSVLKPSSFVNTHHDPVVKETSFPLGNEYAVAPGTNPNDTALETGHRQRYPVHIGIADYRVEGTDQGPKMLPEGPALRLITQPMGNAIRVRYKSFLKSFKRDFILFFVKII